MAEVGSAYMSIMPSAKGFGRSLESEVGGEVNGAGRGVGSKFGTAFKVGAAAVVGGAVIAGAFLKGSISEAREAQKVTAQTNAVIKATGSAAGVTAKQVSALAGSLSMKTGIDDEVIQSGQNMLLTFKNIKNEAGAGNDIFDQTTKTLVDMSAAMGSEPKQAAIQLGKALNDPIKGISALSRVGVTFTEGQKTVIESLVKGGKTAEAQKVILKELNSEFGGSAAAQATAGDKFKVAFGNLQETVGTALLPLVDRVLTGMTEVALVLTNDVGPAFNKVSKFASPFITQFQGLFGGGAGGGIVSQIRSQFLPTIQAAGQYLTTQLLPPIMSVVNAFKYEFTTLLPVVQQIITAIVAKIIPLIPQIKAVLVQVVGTFRDALTLVAAVIRVGTDFMVLIWNKFGGTLTTLLGRTLKNLVTIVQGALNVIQGVIRLVLAVIHGDWGKAWDALKQIVKGAFGIIKGLVQASFAVIQAIFSAAGTVLKAAMSKAWDLVKAAVVKGIELSVRLVRNMPSLMVAAIRGGIVLLSGVGKDLIQGLINGVSAMKDLVVAAVGNIADAAIAWVKAKFHIGSPSKLFHQFGVWNMEGLANGFIAGVPGVLQAVTGATTKVEAAFLTALTSMRDKTKGVLDGLKSDFTSLRDSIASAFSGDLFSATSLFDFTQQGFAQSGLLDRLSAAMRKLLKTGVDPAFISSLFSSGNTALILDFAKGSKADVRTAASIAGLVGSQSLSLGSQDARADIGPKIDVTNRRLENIEKALKDLPKNFGKEINGAATAGHKGRAA